MTSRIAAAAVLLALVACGKKSNYSTGEVDSSRTHVDIGTRTDTVNVPTLGIEKDTVVVSKPVVGRKPVEVTRPTVTVNKKP